MTGLGAPVWRLMENFLPLKDMMMLLRLSSLHRVGICFVGDGRKAGDASAILLFSEFSIFSQC